MLFHTTNNYISTLLTATHYERSAVFRHAVL